ncbi:hypothetical protein RND81_01G047100 [Saponaria officinalis]|uniref:mRNA cap-binding protein n=1 Tax=Saponaria officinalis TaxID=3572 RepID=A0AAW1NE78_SAPOF
MKCVFLLILLCPTHEVFQNKCCFCGAGENVCGAVLSIRFSEDIVSVWNKNASDYQVITEFGLKGNRLLSTMFDIKEYWIQRYG